MSENNLSEKMLEEVKADWKQEIANLEDLYRKRLLAFNKKNKIPSPLGLTSSRSSAIGGSFYRDIINAQMKQEIDWSEINKVVERLPQQENIKNTIDLIHKYFNFETYLVNGNFENSIETMRQMRIKSLKKYKKEVSRNVGALKVSTENLSKHDEAQGRAKLTDYVLGPLVSGLKKLQESEQKAHFYLKYLESITSYITPFKADGDHRKDLTSLKVWKKIIEKLYDSCVECGCNNDQSCLKTAKLLSILFPDIWGCLPLKTAKERIRTRTYRGKYK